MAGEFNSENLKNFLRQNSGIYMPLPGCLEKFDNLADKLTKAESKTDKEKILKEAEKAVEALENESDKKKAGRYVKIMSKIITEGQSFVGKETKRTDKMMEGKIADAKKKELAEKINILRSFTPQQEDLKKSEL